MWTEGEWTISDVQNFSGTFVIWVTCNGKRILSLRENEAQTTKEQFIANAKRICHCVNNFDTAPNAIRGFLKRWKRSGPQGSAQWEKFDAVISGLREAIDMEQSI